MLCKGALAGSQLFKKHVTIAEFILETGNSSMKTHLNMNLGMDKFEFKTSFPSRLDARLTFPSVWMVNGISCCTSSYKSLLVHALYFIALNRQFAL